MATLSPPQSTEAAPGVVPYRLTVDQYLKMIVAGVFPDDAHVELIDGVLAQQMTKYPPHNFTIRRLGDLLEGMLGDRWVVSEEKSVVFGRYWRPEPDVAVARGPDDRYRKKDPGPQDLVLLVEVAESSRALDRGLKWHGYAAAGVPVYWIVDVSKRVVEVYSDPAGRGKTARYREAAVFDHEAAVPVVIDGREVGRLAVKDVLP